MRLVDRHQPDGVSRQPLQEGRRGQPLGRGEHDARAAVVDGLLGLRELLGAQRAVHLDRLQPRPRSLSHWSFMSAIRGDTTTVRPSSSSDGSW
jgi:hypothetical protein